MNTTPQGTALIKQLDVTKATNANLEARVSQLEQQNTDLTTRMSKLEQNTMASSLTSQLESSNMFSLSGMISISGVMIVLLRQCNDREAHHETFDLSHPDRADAGCWRVDQSCTVQRRV